MQNVIYCQARNSTCNRKNAYIAVICPTWPSFPDWIGEGHLSPGSQSKAGQCESSVQIGTMTFKRPNQILSKWMWDTKEVGQLVMRTEVDRLAKPQTDGWLKQGFIGWAIKAQANSHSPKLPCILHNLLIHLCGWVIL